MNELYEILINDLVTYDPDSGRVMVIGDGWGAVKERDGAWKRGGIDADDLKDNFERVIAGTQLANQFSIEVREALMKSGSLPSGLPRLKLLPWQAVALSDFLTALEIKEFTVDEYAIRYHSNIFKFLDEIGVFVKAGNIMYDPVSKNCCLDSPLEARRMLNGLIENIKFPDSLAPRIRNGFEIAALHYLIELPTYHQVVCNIQNFISDVQNYTLPHLFENCEKKVLYPKLSHDFIKKIAETQSAGDCYALFKVFIESDPWSKQNEISRIRNSQTRIRQQFENEINEKLKNLSIKRSEIDQRLKDCLTMPFKEYANLIAELAVSNLNFISKDDVSQYSQYQECLKLEKDIFTAYYRLITFELESALLKEQWELRFNSFEEKFEFDWQKK